MPHPAAIGPAPGEPPGAPPQDPAHIAATIEAFLAQNPNSLLLEDGRTLFDLRQTRYTLDSSHDRATFHLWSDDRNLVRRVLAVTPRARTLRLTTQRLGQPRPQTLELTPDQHLRSPSSRDTTRLRYLRLLNRVLLRAFPDDRSEGFRSAMDLERSFGPAYARGTLTRGQQAWAVIAVNPDESQTTIDGILTLGILWLQHCRDHAAPTSGRRGRLYQGLRLVLPRGAAATTLSRLAWLNPRIAKYELFELDEQTEDLLRRDAADSGNLATRLVHAPSLPAALDRFAEAIPEVLALLPPGTRVLGPHTPQTSLHPNQNPSPRPEPQAKWRDPCISPPPNPLPQPILPTPPSQRRVPHPSQLHRDGWVAAANSSPAHPAPRNQTPNAQPQTCELRLRSSTELAFLLHGLEFARIRSAFAGQSFNRRLEITVGSGAAETLLLPATESHLRELVRHLFDRRRPDAAANTTQDPLFRTQPERWLEANLRADLPALDPALEPAPVYTEVPAFTGAGSNLDRGMLDLLAVTREGELAVIELKAVESLHHALQGLDYWIRIRHHHLTPASPEPGRRSDPSTGLSDLQQHGYFPETRLSPRPPRLLLVAPALHIHPATETILRHLSPTVPWTLIALDERWRTRIHPIWRKRHLDPTPCHAFAPKTTAG